MQAYLTELLTAKAWLEVAATIATVSAVTSVFFMEPAPKYLLKLVGGVCSPFDELTMREKLKPSCSGRHRPMNLLKKFVLGSDPGILVGGCHG